MVPGRHPPRGEEANQVVQVVIHGTTSSSTGVGQDKQQMQQQRQLAVIKDRPQDININPISLRPDFKLFGVRFEAVLQSVS